MTNDTFIKHYIISAISGQEHSCGNKIDYKSEQTATKSADKINTKRGDNKLEAYPCYWCEGWHIGHKFVERI
jgi:hypothetical protein